MIFLQIYLTGVLFALLYVSEEFKDFCNKNNLDFNSALHDDMVIANIIFDSLGSWLTILFYYIGRDR